MYKKKGRYIFFLEICDRGDHVKRKRGFAKRRGGEGEGKEVRRGEWEGKELRGEEGKGREG